MSFNLQEIKFAFNKNICLYIGLEFEKNFNEDNIRNKIVKIALENKKYYIELSHIIIEHLAKDQINYKIKLFDIIDILFKSDVGNYVDQLKTYLFDNFKECFIFSNNIDRKILFKIYYTWKYIVPQSITEKIRKELNMDYFKENFMKDYPGEMKSCEEINENFRRRMEKKNIINNVKKESKEDIIFDDDKEQKKNKKLPEDKIKDIIEGKEAKPKKHKMLGNKRNSSNDKSSDTNSITKKKNQKKKVENKMNNPTNFDTQSNTANNMNQNIIQNVIPQANMYNNINVPQNALLPQMPMNLNNQNNISFMNNNNLNIIPNVINQSTEQQQLAQTLFMYLSNNQFNFPYFSNVQLQGISQIQFNIYKFICSSNIKIDPNLRFFSSLAKFFNESVKNRDTIKINCQEYEDIIKNQEYKQIRQYVNYSIFNNIKKNLCAICGFRALFYNKLIEHLDIHFNYNFLKKEGKNLFRKRGNNRDNWISLDNNMNKNTRNEIGYTLNNLLYYKNMINKSLIDNKNLQQEDANEELMYPIDDNYIRNCELCGDEFKKIFSTKYHYWFYTEIVKIKDEKTKLLVHKTCYDELIKIKK